MSFKRLFSGKIKVKGAGADVVYKFETKEPTLDQIMMTNFRDLGLSEEEKRVLTAKNRRDIYRFQHLDSKLINKYAQNLLSLIKNSKKERVQVEANHAGTFICLALIYSGKLPSDTDIHFKLHSVPMNLFPRLLAKNKFPGHNISISMCNSDSWLTEFRSLQRVPKFIELSHISPQEDLDLVG